MNTKLLDFHLSCRKELNVISRSFNIMFYGYGSKKALLHKMFPSAIHVDCRSTKKNELMKQISKKIWHNLLPNCRQAPASIKEIDDAIFGRREKYKLVMVNFDFSFAEFLELKHFAVLATMENVNVRFGMDDIERFNFVFRDLTTFEPYEEAADIEIQVLRTGRSMNVVKNVPRNSMIVLREILAIGGEKVDMNELFERIKKRLFLTARCSIVPMIAEFIDHGMLRIKNNSEIVISIPPVERKEIVELLSNTLE
ncbi:putative origin recognition complex protein [Ordospora pajunii]|uniref:putative origin recognition complex protein n=1 Tax=Ordospora pajunii TaxID=3039483 RepID=UPI0029528C8B|nr:putative origin recognition complex protein [Ordospora pajunii]KAH9411435.1 putative origin recognition complex protein [Ordospora pajunii]